MIGAPLFRTLLIIGGFLAALYFGSSVLMPIIFSGICAFFVYPLVKKLEGIGMPLVISSFLVVFIILCIGGALGTFIVLEGSDIVQGMPTKSIENAVENPVSTIDNQVDMNLVKYDSEINKGINKLLEKVVSFIPGTLLNINNALVFVITCPVYIFFMLISRGPIRRFYYSSFSDSNNDTAEAIITDAQSSYSSYLRGLILVMTIVAVLTGIGLFALGIKHALFLGLLSGLLTVVPYLGVLVSAALPIIIALLTKDSIWFSVGVVAIFAVVQFLEGNIITPKVMGDQVDINPLVVVLGIVIFGAVGGIIGMVLTIPLLALMRVIASHIPSWKPIYNLLST